jgi:hypothetical protein
LNAFERALTTNSRICVGWFELSGENEDSWNPQTRSSSAKFRRLQEEPVKVASSIESKKTSQEVNNGMKNLRQSLLEL